MVNVIITANLLFEIPFPHSAERYKANVLFGPDLDLALYSVSNFRYCKPVGQFACPPKPISRTRADT